MGSPRRAVAAGAERGVCGDGGAGVRGVLGEVEGGGGWERGGEAVVDV